MRYYWNTSVSQVRGIGPVSNSELHKMKIDTVGDLIEYKPKEHLFPGIALIENVPNAGYVTIQGRITNQTSYNGVIQMTVADDTGHIEARWYYQIYVLNCLHVGQTVTLWGKITRGIMQQPKYSTCVSNGEDITGGMYGVHTDVVRKALMEVLNNLDVPYGVSIYKSLHFPVNKNEYQEALDSLKYRELLLLHVAMEKRRHSIKKCGTKKLKSNAVLCRDIRKWFPHVFTPDQNNAISDIIYDLESGAPMNRLLHGEVGSGKTSVAFYAAIWLAMLAERTLILCPTTVLAQQHYNTLYDMGWRDVGIHVGGEKNKKLTLTIVDTPNNEIEHPSIIIGTTALLSNFKLLKTTSLVIVDEQQKFGVAQRAMIQKYGNPHILLMSATPIPRTLAMTVFGDLNVTTIRGLPVKRGVVVTKWVLPGKREGMYELIDEQLRQGKQIYVVYPRIHSDEEDVENACTGYAEMTKRFGRPGINVGILTGDMTSAVKSATLKYFKEGYFNILVSTIIAEVGLDNPNASVMVVEGADRFGLCQLHQLRGRVCRSTDTVFCFLVSNTANETSIARLDVMEKCNDGFEIAEHDLRLRGPGEIFSEKQHGLPELKFASIVDDYKLSCEAKDEAKNIVDKLDNPVYTGLKEMLEIKYGKTFILSGVA